MKGVRKKNKPQSRLQELMKRPWLFAGAVLGLDIAMLVVGLVLSGVSFEITYSLGENGIVRSEPLAFFGVIAAVVLGINCVLTALILVGTFTHSKSRGAGIIGAAGLLLVSLVMIAGSAFMALGSPVKSRSCYSYSDDSLRLIAEETEPYFGGGKVSFFLTPTEGSEKVILLASTDITEFSENEERYTISWQSDELLQISFTDEDRYRTLTIEVDRTMLGNQGIKQ